MNVPTYIIINDELHYKQSNTGINVANERNAILMYLDDKWNISNKYPKSQIELNPIEVIDFILEQELCTELIIKKKNIKNMLTCIIHSQK